MEGKIRTENGIVYFGSGDEPMKHNYNLIQERLINEGIIKIEAGQVTKTDVFHDNNCPIYSGGYCSCDPWIYINGERIY